MDKFFELNKKIGLCYQKINYLKLFNSSQEDKDAACRSERDEYIEYVNSDAMDFKKIIEEQYNKVLSKIS
jgi:hypothetical protein